MADFDLAIKHVFRWEDPKMTGKVVMDNNGWPVRFGVNKKFHGSLDPRFWSEDQMKKDEALTLAKSVYREEYWRPLHGDEITDQDVASKLLDMAVNQGVGVAIKQVQRVAVTWGKDIKVDGDFGPKTLAAVNELNVQQALVGMRKEWEIRIEQVLEVHPEWATSRDNWTKRANA